MTWDGFFALAIGPDVMFPTVAQEVPAQLAEGSLQVSSLHGLDCTRIGVHCQEPLCLSHRTLALRCAWKASPAVLGSVLPAEVTTDVATSHSCAALPATSMRPISVRRV